MKKLRNLKFVLLLLLTPPLLGCPPYAVTILMPNHGSNFEVGEEILFSGSATDFQDGELNESSLVWTSDLEDGEIGTGTTFTRSDLSEGTHNITLTATNSLEESSSKSITIYIGDITTSTTTTITNATTSTTTTIPCVGLPEPNPTAVSFVDCHWDGLVCTGVTFCVVLENNGCEGNVYVGEGACKVITMREGEETTLCLELGSESCDLCKQQVWTTKVVITRPAQSEDYINCVLPPEPTIESPLDGSTYNEGEPISFKGAVSGKSNDEITFEWKSSNSDEVIGTTPAFTRNDLTAGIHNITLSATDKTGETGKDKISITIDDGSPSGEKVWEQAMGFTMSSSYAAAADDGYLYYGRGDWTGTAYYDCLDTLTFEQKWQFETTGHSFEDMPSSPALSGHNVYTAHYTRESSKEGLAVHSLSADTGAINWVYTVDMNDPLGGNLSPAVANDHVYVTISEAFYNDKLYSLNKEDGELDWEADVGGTCPAVAGGYVYVGGSTKMHCLNALTGEVVWSYDTGSLLYSSPAVSDGYVFFGSSFNDNKVYCLNATTGTEVWTVETGGSVKSSPAVVNGYVYIGSDDNYVYCLDAGSGDVVWKVATADDVVSSPAVTGDFVYVGSNDGYVYCLKAATGETVWKYQTAAYEDDRYVRSSPVVLDGYVYVGGRDVLYCLKAAAGDTGSWPMFKCNAARTGSK